jgi:hypothetical protein
MIKWFEEEEEELEKQGNQIHQFHPYSCKYHK